MKTAIVMFDSKGFVFLIKQMLQALDFEVIEVDSVSKLSDFVDDKKIQLAYMVAKIEQPIINNSPKNSFSLYISIPFCPTRCSYCSFVSHSIGTESAKKHQHFSAPKPLPLFCYPQP